MNDARDLTL